MKKTIAILLVLVIAMVGVWAATETVLVTTTVPVENLIKASAASQTDYDFEATLVTEGIGALASWTTSSATQSIAYIHGKSNSTSGFKITVSAKPLKLTDTTGTYYIGYALSSGNAVAAVPATEDAYTSGVDATGNVLTVSATNSQAFTLGHASVNVKPYNNITDYKQGNYVGELVFTIAAQ